MTKVKCVRDDNVDPAKPSRRSLLGQAGLALVAAAATAIAAASVAVEAQAAAADDDDDELKPGGPRTPGNPDDDE